MPGLRTKLRIFVLLIVLITSGYVYFIATNISEHDVVAYHKFQHQLGYTGLAPGDIVAISSDGLSPERICAFQLEEDAVGVVALHRIYENSLGRILPRFEAFFGFAAGFLPGIGGAAESVADQVEFNGELRSLTKDPSPDGISGTCECAMAQRLLRRERLCTVRGVMVEEADDFVLGVKFSRYSNFVMPEQFAACGLEYSEVVEQMAEKRCDGSNLAWPVMLRSALGLIEASGNGDAQDPAPMN